MNKAQLVEKVADQVGKTKKDVAKVVDVVLKTITNRLKKGEKVTLVGFGSFQVMQRKARKGVNPRTKKTIQIPAKKVPKFSPGKSLREKVK